MINTNLAVMSADELQDLATGLIELPEARLKPTWAYIQSVKYNGMIKDGDCAQPNLIFHHAELPIIKRIYPPEIVHAKVKLWISYLAKKSKTISAEKFQQYLELRRYGLGIDEARKRVGAHFFTEKNMHGLALKYNVPFKYKYELSCRDADLLYSLGIDRFVQMFYDRFYEPVR